MSISSLELIEEAFKILNSDNNIVESFKNEIVKLQEYKQSASSNIIRLGVIGVTSSGKSTLINALLGEDLLPAEAKPSSSQLVSCKKSKHRLAKVYFNDGSSKTFVGKEMKYILSKYGNEQLNRNNQEGVQQIMIETPNFSLNPSVVLIDSPGLDAYGFPGHESLTMETLLPSIDFCLYVTTCKTNSDKKMYEVLNSIAKYNKPLIIVQNMVDAIQPSVDGLKTKEIVARESMQRVWKVIEQSKIKDKSKVHIIQISARNALACRIIFLKGKRLNSVGKEKWNVSNLINFVTLINEVIEKLIPNFDYQRIINLRDFLKTILESISPKILDTPLEVSSPRIDYNVWLKNKNEEIKNKKCEIFYDINEKIGKWENLPTYKYDNEVIKDIVHANKEWAKKFASIISDYNKFLKSICEKLLIQERDLVFNFTPSFNREPRMAHKTIVEEKTNWFVRIISLGFAGKKKVSKTVEDREKTKEICIDFLKASKSDFELQIDKWERNISKSNDKLKTEIQNLYRREEEAKKRSQDSQKFKLIYNELIRLLDKINSIVKPASKQDKKDYNLNFNYEKTKMNKESFLTYNLAKLIKNNLQRQIFQKFTDGNPSIIYSWDKESSERFISQSGLSNYQLIMNPEFISISNKNNNNLFIIINLTQPGFTQNQLMRAELSKLSESKDNILFVIQDFNETIMGGHYKQALVDMKIFLDKNLENKKYQFYPVHSNPIFPLTFLVSQNSNIKNQKMEVDLANEIYNRFPDLVEDRDIGDICDDNNHSAEDNLIFIPTKQIIADIINSFNHNNNF